MRYLNSSIKTPTVTRGTVPHIVSTKWSRDIASLRYKNANTDKKVTQFMW